MDIGDKVIIKFNPHHSEAGDILGTIVEKGVDLVNVAYTNPKNGEKYTRPFGVHNLEPTTLANLFNLSQYHKRLAADFDSLALARMAVPN